MTADFNGEGVETSKTPLTSTKSSAPRPEGVAVGVISKAAASERAVEARIESVGAIAASGNNVEARVESAGVTAASVEARVESIGGGGVVVVVVVFFFATYFRQRRFAAFFDISLAICSGRGEKMKNNKFKNQSLVERCL